MSNGNPTTPQDLYYEVYGEANPRPLLCIHGFGASLYSWRNFKDPLSKNYRLILLDLKGAGKSPKPNDTHYSTQDHADLIYGFIQEKNLRNLTLIGNSLGGALSLWLSIMLIEKQPGRLRSLILIDAGAYKEYIPFYVKLIGVPIIGVAAVYLIPATCMARSVLKLAYYDPGKITEEQIAAYAAPLAAPGGKHALLETGKQIIPPNIDELTANYKDINVPTLIIWGRQDKVIDPIVGNLLDQAIPNSTLQWIDQCGHVPQEERPEATIPLVMDFLRACEE
jgi:pimeloyl-ACP methyl ester carboxylesterase